MNESRIFWLAMNTADHKGLLKSVDRRRVRRALRVHSFSSRYARATASRAMKLLGPKAMLAIASEMAYHAN